MSGFTSVKYSNNLNLPICVVPHQPLKPSNSPPPGISLHCIIQGAYKFGKMKFPEFSRPLKQSFSIQL